MNEGTFESDYTGEPVYLVLGTDQETFDLATLGFSSKSGKITYVSADNSIARVQGSVVKGVAEGRTAIEVTAPNGDVVNVLVYVYEFKSHAAGEDELWLTMGEAMSLRDKVTVTVIPTSHPLSDKLDGMADLTWVSSNEGVVTVLDGNIVTTGTGTANVKAIGTDGSEAVFLRRMSLAMWKLPMLIPLPILSGSLMTPISPRSPRASFPQYLLARRM